jgi:hypothetical protein
MAVRIRPAALEGLNYDLHTVEQVLAVFSLSAADHSPRYGFTSRVLIELFVNQPERFAVKLAPEARGTIHLGTADEIVDNEHAR